MQMKLLPVYSIYGPNACSLTSGMMNLPLQMCRCVTLRETGRSSSSLTNPIRRWYDNVKTSKKESLTDLVNESFKYTCDSLERKYGAIGNKWEWANVKNTHVPHLARIPGFGTKTIYNGGAKSTIDALSESNGPSWRMVVELGKAT